MTTEPSFREKHSRSMRIWHWGTFIIMLGSLITVLLAKTILNTRANIPLVQDTLKEGNIAVSTDQAKSVAHEFNDIIWHWHTYIGYVLAALLLFRILFEFFQPQEQKFIPLLKKALKYVKQPNIDKLNAKHYLLVRCAYLSFYISIFVQVCTGLFMAYSDDDESLKSLRSLASNIHSVFMWIILAYIVLHIAGTINAELSKRNKGLVSDMINGGEDSSPSI
jgi:Ni/Fe-hydrogenase 1 B-type cytochrome subunit